MRDAEIEAWALRVLDQARAGRQSEDARVELKREWGDPEVLARRLAGLANSCRGEPALWLVGVDEDGTVHGAAASNFAAWWQKMAAEFEGLAPDIREIAVPYAGDTVVVIQVETTRAPFVIKNPNFGTKGHSIAREVPWREGTSVRTALREDLIRLLVPRSQLPELELRSARLQAHDRLGEVVGSNEIADEGQRYEWALDVEVYVENVTTELVIPDHRCRCELHASPTGGWDQELTVSGQPVRQFRLQHQAFRGRDPDVTATSTRGHGQLIVAGPGPVSFSGAAITPDGPYSFSHLTNLDGRLTLRIVGADIPVVIDLALIADASTTGTTHKWSTKSLA